MSQNMSDLSDADIQHLMDIGVIPEKNELLGQQMKYANSLRGGPLAQGASTGGVYTAATPLGMLGSMATKYQGNKMADQIGEQQQSNLSQQAAGRKQYFDILRQQLAQSNGGGGGGGGPAVGGSGPENF